MSTLTILFTQLQTTAIIEILLLLTVAAIIGYVTAWLYTRSVYLKKLKAKEAELYEMQTQVINLNSENSTLNNKLGDMANKNNQLMMEMTALKALNKKAVDKTDAMFLKNKETEQLLYETNEALANIAKRKHLLDYTSFGSATVAEKDDLQMISGIGPFIEERLHALDIFTFLQISKFTKKDISTINVAIEYFSGRIERDEWVAQAKELVISEEEKLELLERIRSRKSKIFYDRIGVAGKDEADDLTNISGIGKWINKKLNALAIFTYKQISRFNEDDIDEVTEAIEYFPGRIERDEWILQAKELVRIEGKKADLLKRIQKQKEIISFDNLGVAQKHQANNLTLINGISLWIEERLNILEIYTFEQISRLNSKDIKVISELLEITPSRIEKEGWVSQAREFAKKQVKLNTNLKHPLAFKS
jgi:predicted flap endonuclease-1-like 5' DNA nuclease